MAEKTFKIQCKERVTFVRHVNAYIVDHHDFAGLVMGGGKVAGHRF
jgi:hypothetical protein